MCCFVWFGVFDVVVFVVSYCFGLLCVALPWLALFVLFCLVACCLVLSGGGLLLSFVV